MGQEHNLSQQFGPADVWYKSSASGADVWAYDRGSRQRIAHLQTFNKPWGAGDVGVHHIEVYDESRRGQGIATGMYAKYHARNPDTVVAHEEFKMSSHAKRMMPKLEEIFPGKHVYISNADQKR